MTGHRLISQAVFTVETRALIFSENLTFDTPDVTVGVSGSFPCDCGPPKIPDTEIQGKVAVSAGTLVVDALTIE